MTTRQQEILDLLNEDKTIIEIASALDISRNSVYQHITRMKRDGILPKDWTASGLPARAIDQYVMADRRPVAPARSRGAIAGRTAADEMREIRDQLDILVQRIDSYLGAPLT